MGSWLTEGVFNDVRRHFRPYKQEKREVWGQFAPYTWDYNRYLRVSTPLVIGDKNDFCYSTSGTPDCIVFLRIANTALRQKYYKLRKALKEACDRNGYEWHRSDTYNYCIKAFDQSGPSRSECVNKAIDEMIALFDPIIIAFMNEAKQETEIDDSLLDVQHDLNVKKLKEHTLSCDILPIGQIDFDELQIPPYQRTYKWGRKQVIQLIDDILRFKSELNELPESKKEKAFYRLGSLVLNNNEIVDGQQRIITLSLLFYQLQKDRSVREDTRWQDFLKKVGGFWNRTEYSSIVAFHNITNNLDIIKERSKELDHDFFTVLVEKCQFAVITLPSVPEAFQFFDSQNSRGKDLEAHDLLKAFHLREIHGGEELSRHDEENISGWQDIPTQELVNLFLCLFRIKNWSRNNSARYFGKEDVGAFKGITIDGKNKTVFPSYDSAIILTRLFSDLFFEQGKCIADGRKFPYQLDNVIVNGSRFFDMILHYEKIYSNLRNPNWYVIESRDFQEAYSIINLISSYQGVSRVGDSYVRDVFDALLVYYYDKYGEDNLEKAVVKFYLYAYSIRLTQFRVSVATIDNEVLEGSMFKVLRDSISPFDILNEYVPVIPESELTSNRPEELYNSFCEYNKIK